MPESALRPPGAERREGILALEATARSDLESVDLLLDIRDLIRQGFNNEAIVKRLERRPAPRKEMRNPTRAARGRTA